MNRDEFMTTALRAEQMLLWIFTILCAIVIGGALYEMRVIVPLWAQVPPESVWEFASQRANNPLYTPNSGIRFWIFITPLHLLISIVTFFVALKTRGARRRWLLVASAIFAVMHLSALLYFVPALDKLLTSRAANMDPAEVVSRVRWWVNLSWGRFVFGFIGLLSALRALQLPPQIAKD